MEPFLTTVMDTVPFPIYVKGLDGRYVYLNAAKTAALGLADSDEAVGKTYAEMRPNRPDAVELHEEDLRVASAGERIVYREYRHEHAGQQVQWMLETKLPLSGEDGAPVGMVGVAQDITARKRADIALQSSETRFRSVFESALVGIAFADTAGRFLDTNRALQDMLGYTDDELRSMDVTEVLHPADGETPAELRRAVAHGRLASALGERRLIRNDGHILWCDCWGTAVPDASGAVQYVVIVAVDITDQKHAEIALQQSESRLRSVFDAAPVGIVLADATGRIVQTNRAFQGMLDRGEDDLRAMSLHDVTHEDDVEETRRAMSAILDGESDREQLEKRYTARDGRVVWANTIATPIRRPDGETPYVVAMVEDIGRIREAEVTIQELRMELRHGDGASAPIDAEDTDDTPPSAAAVSSGPSPPGIYPFGAVVGDSPAMQEVYRLVGAVSRSDAPVFITGETGTGKDIIARVIHHEGDRSDRPYLSINCAALPETLVESELFGHERGAFTGAQATQRGKLDLARGGVLLLNEIVEMPPSTQAKLLQVLDEGAFMRIGGSTPIPLDARVLAAMNADASEALESGRLRRDLFHRLHAFHIDIPPLRDRREDIAPIAHYYAAEFSGGAKSMGSLALEALLRHTWPGNVRELRHAVQRAVAASDGPELAPADFRLAVAPAAMAPAGAPPKTFEDWALWLDRDWDAERGPRMDLLQAGESRLIEMALERADGNRTLAAKILGVDRSKIQRRLRQESSLGAGV